MGREHAWIGVIGGTGLYGLGTATDSVAVPTPYGAASDAVSVGTVGDRRVAFLPRHGRGHTIPPHRINHRANLWALRSLGVERIVAPAAVGSLRLDVAPGEVVVCDQFIDHTGGRHESTYFDGPEVAHATMADPYCPELRSLAAPVCRDAGFTVHPEGTVAVIPGPRFSTRAESRRLRAEGGDVVNMTQFPEVALARELGLCYVNLSLVTDYDAGLDDLPAQGAVTQEEVVARLRQHTDALRGALAGLVGRVGRERGCRCAELRALPLGR